MKSFGYLRYDPKHKATKFKPNWLLLQCDDGLASYYRRWIEKELAYDVSSRDWLEKAGLEIDFKREWPITQKGVKVTRSAWGSHISVIRGERIQDRSLWRKYNGKKIWFKYNPENLNTNGKHWWIRVVSYQLEKIRKEIGLTPQPTYYERGTGKLKINHFHLTIGHMLS